MEVVWITWRVRNKLALFIYIYISLLLVMGVWNDVIKATTNYNHRQK